MFLFGGSDATGLETRIIKCADQATTNVAGNDFMIAGALGNGSGADGSIILNAGGNDVLEINAVTLKSTAIPAYDDDAAAGGGGLVTGEIYQTTGSGSSPLNVAGILMIKQ